MSLTRKDGASTVLAALVALVYLSNSHGWGVPLLSSNRWAAGAILVLGMGTCTLGRAATDRFDAVVAVLAAIGVATLALAVYTLATGHQWPLALLALATLVLWAGSTVRHAAFPARRAPRPA
jgi:hypothetical protein